MPSFSTRNSKSEPNPLHRVFGRSTRAVFTALVLCVCGFQPASAQSAQRDLPVRPDEDRLLIETEPQGSDAYSVGIVLDLRTHRDIIRYLLEGNINRTIVTVQSVSDGFLSRQETVIARIERSARFDAFNGMFVLDDSEYGGETRVFGDEQAFLQAWIRLPPVVLDADRITVQGRSGGLELEVRVEKYELDSALWLLSPFLQSRYITLTGSIDFPESHR